ncbi:Fc.00g076460.m01.CDS01 [Cosmosporella sp. VM-42]
MAFPRRLNRDKPPVLLKLRSSSALIVTTASFAVFTDIFLYGVIVPVLPFSLENRVGVAADKVQYWVSISLAVFGAALLASSPVWGYLADRIQNRRIPMIFGLVLLLAATIFLCLARNIAMLLVGRILQGLSAALTWTVGLALVVDTVDRSHVGAATGWIGTAMSLGILIAPLLGGVVYGKGGYYSVFAMCFGLIAVDIALRLAIIEVKDAKRWFEDAEHTDPRDSVARPVQTEEGVAEQRQVVMGEPSKEEIRASRNPLTTLLCLLRKPRLLAALWGTLVDAIIQTSFDSTLPLFVNETFGWDSIGAGLIFLPVILPSFLSPLVGAFCDRYGPKWISTFGFVFATPFLICLRFVSEDTMAHKVMLCGLLVGVGIGMSCVFGPLMAEITWSVQGDEDDTATVPYAQAYGLYNMAFSGGALVGPIMGGLIRESAGWGTVGWSLGLLMFVTSITSVIWIGSPLSISMRGRSQ